METTAEGIADVMETKALKDKSCLRFNTVVVFHDMNVISMFLMMADTYNYRDPSNDCFDDKLQIISQSMCILLILDDKNIFYLGMPEAVIFYQRCPVPPMPLSEVTF